MVPLRDPLNDRLIAGRGMRPEYDKDPVLQIVGIVGMCAIKGSISDLRGLSVAPGCWWRLRK
jgi:hypothetical protein